MAKKKKRTVARTKPADGRRGKTVAELRSEPIHMAEHAIGPASGPMGWEDESAWVDDQLSRMPQPFLEDTQYFQELSKVVQGHVDIMPWTLEEKALGGRLRAHYQARGTCVSQGFARGVQFTSLADMVVRGEGEEWVARVHPGSIYAASRVEIGGGRISGDGSIGAWAAQAVVKMGVLYRIQYPGYDLTADQDELYSVEWGQRGRGVPDVLEPAMREHPITATSLVTTAEQYKVVAYDWRMVPICSGRGFTTVRDKYGMCSPSGTWRHCMLGAGLVAVKHPLYTSEGRLCVPHYQSWGQNNPSGNDRVVLHSGEEITLPPGVFLADLEVVARDMLSGRDSFALAGSKGWVYEIK